MRDHTLAKSCRGKALSSGAAACRSRQTSLPGAGRATRTIRVATIAGFMRACLPRELGFGMTDDLDIYRAANILVKEYGAEQAPLMAAKRVDAMLALGDVNGQRTWKAVLRAVQEIIRTERGPGELVN